jgi:formylmethanofuran dehydrogenase subunit E
MTTLEQAAKLAWKIWGEAWSMFTACSRCGEMKHCKGRKRASMLCLECFDEKAPR